MKRLKPLVWLSGIAFGNVLFAAVVLFLQHHIDGTYLLPVRTGAWSVIITGVICVLAGLFAGVALKMICRSAGPVNALLLGGLWPLAVAWSQWSMSFSERPKFHVLAICALAGVSGAYLGITLATLKLQSSKLQSSI